MSLLPTLTVKPLLYAIAVLALSLLLSNLGWWAHASSLGLQRDVADASRDAAMASLTAATTEKQAWKNKAGELAAANVAGQKVVDQLQRALQDAHAEQGRLQEEGRRAVAAAQAAADDADRTLKDFVDRYARQLRNPDCASALATVQRSCPAFEGY